MKLFGIVFRKLSSKIGIIGTGSLLALVSLAAVGTYSIMDAGAHYSGITGYTQKTTSAGCTCHCGSAQSSTTVSLTSSSGSSPLTTAPSTTYNFTITVANSGENDGGCDISTYSGNGLTAGTGLYASNGELTHSSPKSFSGGSTSWSFTYTTGTSAGWDTIYATGNAVNGDGSNDGGDCTDKWNWAPKFIIHTVTPPVRMALSRSTIPLGQLRVGHRIADSLKVTSNGVNAITINSSGMLSGVQFSSFPTTTSRTINAGSTEIDSVIFTPTTRGSFTDSLIFNTNSDTVPEQRMGLAVSGQGIQAVFNSTNGNTLAFGNVRVGATLQKTFAFSNSGDDTLFLQTPSISGTGFSIVSGPASLTLPPNQNGNVVVKFAPTAQQSYSGSLSFTASNNVSAPTVTLSGSGTSPQIQISNSNNLGSIHVGNTLQGTVTFKNVGNDTLHISNASITQTSTLFVLGSFDQVVLPNATGTVHIAYTPTAEETDNATLNLTTDDPANTSISVAISGTGVLAHMVIAQRNDTVNMGLVKVNSSVTATIGINNNGGANLNITSVTAGPTPFVLDVSTTLVSAGSSSNVTVGFSPTTTGTFTGTLIIKGDDQNNPSDTVYLSGTGINSALSISPGSLNFGQVPVLTTAFDTITLRDSGKANVSILSVKLAPTSGAFAIVGATPTQVVAGGSATIVLSFKPDTSINYSATLTITTDDATVPTRTVNISGVGLKDAFSVTPSPLDFGQVPILTTVTDTITLSNSGTSAITISNTKLLPATSAFAIVGSAPTQVTAGATATIVVSFHPDTAGSYSASLTLTTSDPSIPIRTISINGVGIKGSLTANPSQVNFGTLLVGHDSTITVTLHDAGQASVTITSINLTGPAAAGFRNGAFSTPQTIAAGGSSTMILTFAPTTLGSYSGNMELSLTDGSSVNIPLQGVAANSGVSQNGFGASKLSLTLSPNPATNAVTAHASISESIETQIEVFDAVGHNVLSMPMGRLSQGTHDLPLPIGSLPSGSYFVRITSSNGDSAEAKLIIE